MIVIESREIDGRAFTYTYSDLSVYIMNEKGQKYIDALDLVEYPHTYTETDEPLPEPLDPEEGEVE